MKTSSHIRIAATCALLAIAAPALAQSNIDQSNKFAWGENIGWVNFGTEPFIGAHGARYDAGAGRFRGYAWGENVGWINLDDATRFVGIDTCPWDLTGDGAVGSADLGALLGRWGNSPPPLCQAATFGSVPPQVGSSQLAKLLGNRGPCP